MAANINFHLGGCLRTPANILLFAFWFWVNSAKSKAKRTGGCILPAPSTQPPETSNRVS
ncbi:hypothetical protein GGTG_08483 [Gaeumannomyces tritici R3-111a-1]|uniref:Uncharacterized protein n=1 Tax=Gaeumannomyces tritici (strain R3-111a-1) TaxID=644352 RepID=J3P4P6_GAET3|nr:hypothetical protein GGTG_08483 [Gaeumannomyces tritici R3-111a-1]EJT74643.1 hypothetical protein GGTG_08483 [Gaeumannomyces tritici R3-111a-1]